MDWRPGTGKSGQKNAQTPPFVNLNRKDTNRQSHSGRVEQQGAPCQSSRLQFHGECHLQAFKKSDCAECTK